MDDYILIRTVCFTDNTRRKKRERYYFNGLEELFCNSFHLQKTFYGCTGFSYDAFLIGITKIAKNKYNRLFFIFWFNVINARPDYDFPSSPRLDFSYGLHRNLSMVRNSNAESMSVVQLYCYYNTLLSKENLEKNVEITVERKKTNFWYKLTPKNDTALLLKSICLDGEVGGLKLFYTHNGSDYELIKEHSIQKKTYSNINVILPVGATLWINSTTPEARFIELHCKKIRLEKINMQGELR